MLRLLVLLLWSAASSLPAQTTSPPNGVGTPSPAAKVAERGRSQFAQSCAFCHGRDASGGAEGPNLARSSVVRHDKIGDLIGPVIREGRPGKGMPPIPLTPTQIDDVVFFLHARITESDRRSAGRPSPAYSLKTLLTGDAEEGKSYFDTHCSSCHSASRDLVGIAAKYSPVDLQARFLYPQDLHPTASVTTRSGKVVKGELLSLDAFNIALRDSDGWYHSWPITAVTIDVPDPLAPHRDLLQHYSQADVHNLFAYLETLK